MYNIRTIAIQLLNFILAAIVLFLGLRVIFRLFGANTGTPFVSWILDVSEALVSPFAGIFRDLPLGNGALDLSALTALVFYIILFSIITSLIRAIVSSAHRESLHAH